MNPEPILERLGSGEKKVRLDAQERLALWLREEPDPQKALKRGLLTLAPQAYSERQRRILGALLGDITTPRSAPLLVAEGNAETIQGTVARRAFRRFADSAPPSVAVRALADALLWCDRSRASEQLIVFLCDLALEAAAICPSPEWAVVAATLEKVVARQRRQFFGGRTTDVHFAATLEILRQLLPASTLPLPADRPAHGTDSLPRPAGSKIDTSDLPVPSTAKSTGLQKTWWRR